jgi:hypothetical protein
MNARIKKATSTKRCENGLVVKLKLTSKKIRFRVFEGEIDDCKIRARGWVNKTYEEFQEERRKNKDA